MGGREGGRAFQELLLTPGSALNAPLTLREGDSKRKSRPSTVSPPAESRGGGGNVGDSSTVCQDAWVLVPLLSPVSY